MDASGRPAWQRAKSTSNRKGHRAWIWVRGEMGEWEVVEEAQGWGEIHREVTARGWAWEMGEKVRKGGKCTKGNRNESDQSQTGAGIDIE